MANLVLLTGAGFTANFGTPLAEGMWAKIFNYCDFKKCPKLRSIMLDPNHRFNYENIYTEIINDKSRRYQEEEKEVFNDALIKAYNDMDEIIKNLIPPSDGLNFYELKCFLSRFNLSYIFTLNQDLFIERHYCDSLNSIEIPIMGSKSVVAEPSNCERDKVSLPESQNLNEQIKSYVKGKNSLTYIKLHGSQNWYDTSGSGHMIIGTSKKEDINGSPLLKFYSKLFKEALSQENTKLLIIGYSFGDEHINDIICEYRSWLEIFVINPIGLEEFCKTSVGSKMKVLLFDKCLSGYYPVKLSEIFPANGNGSMWLENLKEAGFR